RIRYFLRLYCSLFFLSSRRRHTRSTRDWSSDVCSSDLSRWTGSSRKSARSPTVQAAAVRDLADFRDDPVHRLEGAPGDPGPDERSEERRVGKEGRCRRTRGEREEIKGKIAC